MSVFQETVRVLANLSIYSSYEPSMLALTILLPGTKLRVQEASTAESAKNKANKLLNCVFPEHIVLQLSKQQIPPSITGHTVCARDGGNSVANLLRT